MNILIHFPHCLCFEKLTYFRPKTLFRHERVSFYELKLRLNSGKVGENFDFAYFGTYSEAK